MSKSTSKPSRLSRRTFLKSVGAVALPMIVPASVFGRGGRVAPSERIILAGFSQGGAIVLHTALRSQQPLAGTMALSSYVPLSDSLASEASQSNKDMPLFMAHGLQDDIVNYKYGAQSRMLLMDKGYNVDWHDYPMSHSVCMEEISDIRQWIMGLLSDNN